MRRQLKVDTKCLLTSLAISLCVGFACSAVLYIRHHFTEKVDNYGVLKPMEQKSFKGVFSARVRLYTGYNFTGDWDEYYFTPKDYVKCVNLQNPIYFGKIQSVDTFGTCIRLYSDHCCKGQSMAYYPRKIADGEGNSPGYDVNGVYSLSPCFPDELDKVLSSKEKLDKKTGPLQNNHAGKGLKGSKSEGIPSNVSIVPDELCIGMHCSYVMKTRGLPIKFYRVGYGGRVEFVWAEIHLANISQGEEHQFFRRVELGDGEKEGDRMGHYIGLRLGPQQHLPFENIFPQSAHNARLLRREENKVLELVKAEKEIWVGVSVVYLSEESTRPIGFVYRIQQPHSSGDIIVSQNYLPNLSSN